MVVATALGSSGREVHSETVFLDLGQAIGKEFEEDEISAAVGADKRFVLDGFDAVGTFHGGLVSPIHFLKALARSLVGSFRGSAASCLRAVRFLANGRGIARFHSNRLDK